MQCRSLFKSYSIIFLNIYLLHLMYLDWQNLLDCIVTDSYLVRQAGKETMAALKWAKQGTLHRTSCSFHDKVSGLSRHSLSWGVTVHQNSPISIMQCRCLYHLCVLSVSCYFFVLGRREWRYALMLFMCFKACMWPKHSKGDALLLFFLLLLYAWAFFQTHLLH